MYGGTYDDKIWSGENVAGSIKIHGDNQTSEPLVEDPTGLNRNDGDDYIDIGDNNMDVTAFGQGGNDRLVGGYGANQVEKLFGGSGDDTIWMINED